MGVNLKRITLVSVVKAVIVIALLSSATILTYVAVDAQARQETQQ